MCVEALLNAGPNPACPQDGSPCKREETFTDRCAQKEILALECFCPEKSLGCRWTGKLASVGAHVERECPFTKVACLFAIQGCTALLLRCQLAKHIEKECLYKNVNCLYCNCEIPEISLEQHLHKCPKRPISCPRGCERKGIVPDTLGDHLTFHCPLEPVQCSFTSVGCSFEGLRQSLHEHLKESLSEHLMMCVKAVEELTLRVQELEHAQQNAREKSDRLEVTLAAQAQALAAAKETISTQQVNLSTVEKFVTSQKKTLANFHQTFEEILNDDGISAATTRMTEMKNQIVLQEERLSSLEIDILRQTPETSRLQNRRWRDTEIGDDRRLEQLERSMTLYNIQMADLNLKMQMMDTASFDGSFLWKIDDYSRRLNEAITGKIPSLYSPPFFTDRHGYKVCARLYLNGDGRGKGRYMSLFFIIMRGEYDALLPWPFRQKVTFKLLDQERTQDVTETFQPDPNSASFQRPYSEMNVASGCPQFCSHTVLNSRSGYIKENTVFIKILTESTDQLRL